jgi:hypothetical protein
MKKIRMASHFRLTSMKGQDIYFVDRYIAYYNFSFIELLQFNGSVYGK